MMKKNILLFPLFLIFSACGKSGFDDLKVFVDQTLAVDGNGNIEPIPTFSPYRPFDYNANLLRAPFDKPVVIVDALKLVSKSSVKPDENRLKQYLESFSVESLTMVGTIEKNGIFFALLSDPSNSVHYVKEGDYIGKNHGRILRATSTNIQLMEIISAGGGWVERPRSLKLREVEGQ
jgi:type IV pilus assembly protein PilP